MTTTEILSRDWSTLLDDAGSERDVVVLARDYLACWTPSEIAALPADCRPGLLHDHEDIFFWAFEFTRHHVDHDGDSEFAMPLLKLRTFFTHAAARLSKVTAAARGRAAALRA